MIVSTMLVMDKSSVTVQTEQREVRALPSRRRRVWSLEEKQRIVGESLEPGASVSLVARRNDINTNMLFTWRRQLGGGEAAGDQPVTFVPAEITGEVSAGASPRGDGRIEIVLPSGAHVIVGRDVDEAALTRVIKVLTRR